MTKTSIMIVLKICNHLAAAHYKMFLTFLEILIVEVSRSVIFLIEETVKSIHLFINSDDDVESPDDDKKRNVSLSLPLSQTVGIIPPDGGGPPNSMLEYALFFAHEPS